MPEVSTFKTANAYEVVGNHTRRIGLLDPSEKRELTLVEHYKEQHQAVARMFAAGMTPSMIRRNTGYSHRRLTLLWNSPSFQELIAIFAQRFAEKLEEKIDAYTDLATANMIRAEGQIAEHLDRTEDEGELLPVAVLDRIAQGRADRFGYSKHSVVKHEHDFAAALDRAIARSGKQPEIKQIEGQAVEVLSGPPRLVASQEMSEVPTLRHNHAPPPASPSFSRILEPIKRRKIV